MAVPQQGLNGYTKDLTSQPGKPGYAAPNVVNAPKYEKPNQGDPASFSNPGDFKTLAPNSFYTSPNISTSEDPSLTAEDWLGIHNHHQKASLFGVGGVFTDFVNNPDPEKAFMNLTFDLLFYPLNLAAKGIHAFYEYKKKQNAKLKSDIEKERAAELDARKQILKAANYNDQQIFWVLHQDIIKNGGLSNLNDDQVKQLFANRLREMCGKNTVIKEHELKSYLDTAKTIDACGYFTTLRDKWPKDKQGNFVQLDSHGNFANSQPNQVKSTVSSTENNFGLVTSQGMYRYTDAFEGLSDREVAARLYSDYFNAAVKIGKPSGDLGNLTDTIIKDQFNDDGQYKHLNTNLKDLTDLYAILHTPANLQEKESQDILKQQVINNLKNDNPALVKIAPDLIDIIAKAAEQKENPDDTGLDKNTLHQLANFLILSNSLYNKTAHTVVPDLNDMGLAMEALEKSATSIKRTNEKGEEEQINPLEMIALDYPEILKQWQTRVSPRIQAQEMQADINSIKKAVVDEHENKEAATSINQQTTTVSSPTIPNQTIISVQNTQPSSETLSTMAPTASPDFLKNRQASIGSPDSQGFFVEEKQLNSMVKSLDRMQKELDGFKNEIAALRQPMQMPQNLATNSTIRQSSAEHS